MATEEDKALAHRFHVDIFQGGDLDAADELCAPDFVIHAPGLPPELQRGPEGVKRFAAMLRRGFGDVVEITHEDTIAEGDKVVIRWSSRGTHRGEFLGIPPTGKATTTTGIDIFRVEGGRLAELWQNWDQLGLLQQLGALPAPASGPAGG
jgi:steroid delta-isomerase-like uncharacterized protein